MPALNFQSLIKSLKEFVHVRDWEQFHSPKNLSVAIFVEAAEIAELFTWVSENDSYNVAKEKQNELESEIADVLMYLLLLSDKVGCNPLKAALDKMQENEIRYPVNKAKGNARKYSDLAEENEIEAVTK